MIGQNSTMVGQNGFINNGNHQGQMWKNIKDKLKPVYMLKKIQNQKAVLEKSFPISGQRRIT